jgi:hypothetical protein
MLKQRIIVSIFTLETIFLPVTTSKLGFLTVFLRFYAWTGYSPTSFAKFRIVSAAWPIGNLFFHRSLPCPAGGQEQTTVLINI